MIILFLMEGSLLAIFRSSGRQFSAGQLYAFCTSLPPAGSLLTGTAVTITLPDWKPRTRWSERPIAWFWLLHGCSLRNG